MLTGRRYPRPKSRLHTYNYLHRLSPLSARFQVSSSNSATLALDHVLAAVHDDAMINVFIKRVLSDGPALTPNHRPPWQFVGAPYTIPSCPG